MQVRKLGEGERDTERGPASPLPAKKPSLLKRAYDLTMGNTADSTVSSANSSARSVRACLGLKVPGYQCCLVPGARLLVFARLADSTAANCPSVRSDQLLVHGKGS